MRIDRKKLVGLMIDKDMNVNDLVLSSGLSRNTVSGVKNGKSCTTETAKKIAKALDAKMCDLIGNQE